MEYLSFHVFKILFKIGAGEQLLLEYVQDGFSWTLRSSLSQQHQCCKIDYPDPTVNISFRQLFPVRRESHLCGRLEIGHLERRDSSATFYGLQIRLSENRESGSK